MSSTILVIQFLTFIINFFLGFFVILKNPRSSISWYFCLLAWSISAWNLSLFFTISTIGQSLFWGRLAFSFGALMPMGLSLFALSFPKKEKFFWLKALPAVLPALFFFAISPTDYFIKDVQVANQLYVTGNFSSLLLFYMLYSFGFLALPFASLIYKYNHSVGIQRMQLKYVTVGILTFFIPLFLTQLILPIFGIFKLNNLGPLFSIPMVSMVMYAITRYRFLDIRLVIQRSVFYLILITVATAMYIGLVAVAQNYLTHLRSGGPLLSYLITSVVIVMGYPWFKEYFHKKTDRFFFKGTYDYWETLGDLSQALISDIELSRLLDRIGKAMKKDFKVSFINFWILSGSENKFTPIYGEIDNKSLALYHEFINKARNLKNEVIICEELEYKTKNIDRKTAKFNKEICSIAERLEIAVIVPVFYQDCLKGIFLIGNKLSSDPFTRKDMRLLTIFARHAGAVFNNAELYEEIKSHNLTLEAKVQDRTQELKRLFDAQSHFLADISHELQTPLSIIKGNISALSREKGLDKYDKIFNTVDDTLDNISNLLNNLMALARLDFEQPKFAQEPLGLKKILEEVYDGFGPLASDKKISLSLSITPEEGGFRVKGNEPLLKQLFLNLLSNAIKFTNQGGDISIALTETPQSVIVSVGDTGIGISEKDLPYIFERFYQATNGEFKKGIGLGLAICKKIADGHNAAISVQSILGQGSLFSIEFPRIYDSNPAT